MKFVCDQKELVSALSLVSKAIPNRPTHPVLANIKISATEDNGIKLEGFDLALSITAQFEGQVDEPGETTIPSKFLLDLISKLPSEDICLKTDSADLTTLTSSSGRYEIRGLSSEDYPTIPGIDNEFELEIDKAQLLNGLKVVLFCASSDETKQVLTGVNFSFEDTGLKLAATDGHRLSVAYLDCPGEATDLTIPARGLRELEKLILADKESDTVRLEIGSGYVKFTVGNSSLMSRVLEGQFPNYPKLIPGKELLDHEVTVDRKTLLGAIDRLSVFSDPKNAVFSLEVDEGNQEISCYLDGKDVGKGKESLPAQITGDSITAACNVKYLIEGIKSLTTSEVTIKLSTGSNSDQSTDKPILLSPLGGIHSIYLLMPVSLR